MRILEVGLIGFHKSSLKPLSKFWKNNV